LGEFSLSFYSHFGHKQQKWQKKNCRSHLVGVCVCVRVRVNEIRKERKERGEERGIVVTVTAPQICVKTATPQISASQHSGAKTTYSGVS